MTWPPAPTYELESGAAAVAIDQEALHIKIKTGGTAGSEDVTVGDGTGARVGERKLIELDILTDASDLVNLDHANIVNAAGTTLTNLDLDAEGEFVLVEWNGVKWQIIWSDATEAT